MCLENRLKLSEIVRRESSPALNEDKSKMKEREREREKGKRSHFQVSNALFLKIPQRRKWQPTPVFLPGKSHGQRSLAGYSTWGRRVGHD